MDPPIDLAQLSPPARKILDPKTPAPLRQMAAKGIAPGLRPSDAVTVLCLLAESEDEGLASTARATIERLPAPLLNGALAADLPPGVIAVLAPRYAADAPVMEKVLALPSLTGAVVATLAAAASEEVAELIAVNEERLLATPEIIERLYMNRRTRMSTADRVLELAVRHKLELKGIPSFREASAAIVNELIAEASAEPTPDDVLFRETEAIAEASTLDPTVEDTHRVDEESGEEIVDDKFLPLHAKLANMTISNKIRKATLGNAAERMILVRDTNRLVAQAVARSPLLQENEVVRMTASRNVPEEVLRIIATDREWTRSHQIKLNLVSNPRTPFAFSSKLVPHLREHELKALAKSKNVTGAISTAAKQQLLRRQKSS